MSSFHLQFAGKPEIEIYYGVDHVTSTFITVLDTSKDEDSGDYTLFSADNQGVNCSPNATDKITRLTDEYKKRFQISRDRGNPYPNLHPEDIIKVLIAIDYPVTDKLKQNIYYNLD